MSLLKKAYIFYFIFLLGTLIGQVNTVTPDERLTNDSLYTSLLFEHLGSNFDDIHDVSMRFHHLDHRLNGIIQLNMHWNDGRLSSSSVVKNETGNEEFASELLAKINKWYIEGLEGPYEIVLPLRIKIVGSDSPEFPETGILTGEVYGDHGKPLANARLSFQSAGLGDDSLHSCYSNSEGIFVKTLIPIGSWEIECVAPGYDIAILHNVIFAKGSHIRKKIILESKSK